MNPVAFFLCAGQQARWDSGGFKQLVDIGGQRLLERSVLQFQGLGFEPVIVAQSDALRINGFPLLHVPPTRNVLETVCHTRKLWTTPVMLCCGDVYWTDTAIEQVRSQQCPEFTFYTNTWDIFGLRIDQPHQIDQRLKEISPATIEDGVYGRLGRLGHLYRVLHGVSDKQFNYGKKPGPVSMGHAVVIRDRTTDVDSPGKYETLLSCIKK